MRSIGQREESVAEDANKQLRNLELLLQTTVIVQGHDQREIGAFESVELNGLQHGAESDLGRECVAMVHLRFRIVVRHAAVVHVYLHVACASL